MKRCVHFSKRSAKRHVSHRLIRKAWALATCLNCTFVKCSTPLFSCALNVPKTKERDWKFAACFGENTFVPRTVHSICFALTQWSTQAPPTWGSEHLPAFQHWTLGHGPVIFCANLGSFGRRTLGTLGPWERWTMGRNPRERWACWLFGHCSSRKADCSACGRA